jgi:hypothetical protein
VLRSVPLALSSSRSSTSSRCDVLQWLKWVAQWVVSQFCSTQNIDRSSKIPRCTHLPKYVPATARC